MTKLRVLDLFSGIGGFSLGLERTGGFETVAFCEIEEFPRKVLRKRWPEVPIFKDVRNLRGDQIGQVDVICGGFPCQDISVAGRRAGFEGQRSGLWVHFGRLVSELRPRYVLVENVANLLSGPRERRGGWFGRILGELAELGYDAEWANIPAAAVGLHQARERVWVVAYRDSLGRRCIGQRPELLHDLCGARQRSAPPPIRGRENVERRLRALVASPLCREGPSGSGGVPYGDPHRLDRLKAIGNAVVPQIPELIGHAILESLA